MGAQNRCRGCLPMYERYYREDMFKQVSDIIRRSSISDRSKIFVLRLVIHNIKGEVKQTEGGRKNAP